MTVRCELVGPIHPLTGEPRRRSAGTDLFQLWASLPRRRRSIDATYEVAHDSDEFKNSWADTDSLDAEPPTHSQQHNHVPVRGIVCQRSDC